jgi:oligoribonuclease
VEVAREFILSYKLLQVSFTGANMASKSSKNLIWIDLEMTGLDVQNDRVLEIAIVVTDTHLNVIDEGPVFAIFQENSALDKMDEWNTKQHGKSGLIERVKQSSITESIAEEAMLEFLQEYVPAGKSPMCGNSICQDRRFLYRYMPKLEQYFHYRNLDVSTLKELAKRWKSEIFKDYKKKTKHEALQDIYDSIDELKFYREHFIHLPAA